VRKLLVGVVALMLVPVVADAGGGGHAGLCAGFATGTEVAMYDSCFEGTAHFAPAGETITVVNHGELPHTFTAVDGSFDTGQLAAGEAAQVTVNESGILQVYCSLHGTATGQGMAGVLIVGEPDPTAIGVNLDAGATGAEDQTGRIEALEADVENQANTIAALTSSQSRLTETVQSLVDDSPHPGLLALIAAAVGATSAVLMVVVMDRRRSRVIVFEEVDRVPAQA
jgi:plastocyanin